MSLDVYLIGEEKTIDCICNDCGDKHSRTERKILFDANITHNLNKMAMEAGIYEALWRPEEIGVTKAKDIIEKIRSGLDLMKKYPERFKKFDASNGWGTYEDFVPWIEDYLNACVEYPEAEIDVSR